jgi:peptide deformylase
MKGEAVEIEAEGLLAIALQHEVDHLEGTLLLDRSSPLKREFYKKRVRKSLAKTG